MSRSARSARTRATNFFNIADIGTGTGILAFASLALWPRAKCLAADIDATAIDVAKENALINGFSPGHGPGELLFATADGMDSPLILARSPFDLLIANILAGPLIGLATAFADALEPNGVIILQQDYSKASSRPYKSL